MEDLPTMAIKSTPQIALIGGGYTLQRVGELLSPDEFVITSRNESTCAAWRARGWHAHQVSLEDRASIEGLFTVYPHIRQVVDSVPPIRKSADPAAGVKNLVAVLQGKQLNKVIYLSTTGVFGVRDGSIVTEETSPKPWNSQGNARWLSEQAYRAGGMPLTALRLPAIYGFDRGLLFSIRSGGYRLVGTGDSWTNRIHVDDLARVVQRALETSELPPILCVADDEPARARDVAHFICSREGLPMPGSISEEEVLSAGGYTMLSNQRVQNARMKQVLGLSLLYPTYREGFYPHNKEAV